MRVLVVGGTGTIGRATVRALAAAGHDVVCLGRREVASVASAIGGMRFDAAVSCMSSRTGVAADAWAVDHRANLAVMAAARAAGVEHFVLLSAICVQRPRLAFQHAKLAFEAALAGSGMRFSIVRPTAYFKSLTGQMERVRRGKPFLLFGDGRATSCKPIADDDLARFLVGCLTEPARWDRVLPIGGPGPAVTPRETGERMFALLGRPARFRSVPPGLLRAIAAGLGAAGLRQQAELARIGHYYATESMLVLDGGRYSDAATPETGTEHLFDHLARLAAGDATVERGAHSVF